MKSFMKLDTDTMVISRKVWMENRSFHLKRAVRLLKDGKGFPPWWQSEIEWLEKQLGEDNAHIPLQM